MSEHVPFIEARGLKFHVATLGEGAPTVMIHGLLVGSLASWYFTVAPAVAAQRRVLLYDLRGHGLSTRPGSGYDVESMADDLAALLPLAGEGRVALVGHSYGALIALRYAMRHPDAVSKLVLVEAPLPPPRFPDLYGFLAKTPEQLLAELPDEVRLAVSKGKRQARRFVEAVGQLTFNTTMVADVRRESDVSDEALGRVSCDTLCVYGRRSSALAVGDRLARAMPRASLVTLEGGHFLPLEATAPLASHLREFLRG